jgi:hypothetical protein
VIGLMAAMLASLHLQTPEDRELHRRFRDLILPSRQGNPILYI